MSSFASLRVCRSRTSRASSSESSSFSSKKTKKKNQMMRISPTGKERYRQRELKEDEDIDGQFALVRFKRWLKSLHIETMSTSEFVFTRKMGIGGIVLEDKEERDVIFRIPLGERRRTSEIGATSPGGIRRKRRYRRRCDGTCFYAPIANSSGLARK